MRSSRVLAVVAVLVALAVPSVAAQERVESDVSYTRTLAAQDHDSFEVTAEGGQSRTISFTADRPVDYYMMLASHYAEYSNPGPNSTGFYALTDRENARDFTDTTEASGRIYVIDNADISQSGASPSGPVTYTVTVRGPSLLDQLFLRSCGGWLVLGIVLVIGTSYWLFTPPKAFRETSVQLRAMLWGK